jgi:GNAT superfamily N-acetyltransferase
LHADGYVKLPPGKLANAVTWLELDDPSPAGIAAPEGLALRRLGPADAVAFHALYRAVGTDWLWAGLIGNSESEIAARLARPDIMSFAAEVDRAGVGMLDLEVAGTAAEVVYFGFVPAFTGKGAGVWLMDEAKRIVREAGLKRLWLHTCNFDDPRALPFYRKQGFRITSVGYEIMDDPRVLGLLPKTAAPHVPLVEG